ncbi:uncharacterized protein LOC128956526 [Oppia nitens]|uniref:uncharacterized protein LOC128956526 n=1 Tax=Oppia nitens TaxID=1686743 RepID=UPI0023DB0D97|nr:uncharacterized protein LOC128956526 [Oppia nitens]
MYNNFGQQFQFDVSFPNTEPAVNSDSTDEPLVIVSDNSVVTNFSTDIVAKLAIKTIVTESSDDIEIYPQYINYRCISCNAFNGSITNGLAVDKTVVKCLERMIGSDITTKTEYNLQYKLNDSIVFSPVANSLGPYVIAMDRQRKGVGKFIYLLANETLDSDKCKEQNYCWYPNFIDDLPDDLWPLVDGIVDYGYLVYNKLNSNRSGHILFFNIDGKPYYCSTPLNQTLSPKCKSKDSLKPYAINCQNIWTQTTTQTHSTLSPTTDSTNKNDFIPYIMAAIVIIIVVLIVIVICLIICYLKKPTEDKNTLKPESNGNSMASIRSLDRHQSKQPEIERSKLA